MADGRRVGAPFRDGSSRSPQGDPWAGSLGPNIAGGQGVRGPEVGAIMDLRPPEQRETPARWTPPWPSVIPQILRGGGAIHAGLDFRQSQVDASRSLESWRAALPPTTTTNVRAPIISHPSRHSESSSVPKAAMTQKALDRNLNLGPVTDTRTKYSYFQASGLGGPPQAKEKESLTKLFDSYRSPNDDPDVVTVEGTMRYFADDLGLNLENAEILLPCEIIQAPAIGEMSREGFVDGWKKLGLDTIPKQKAYLAHAVATLSTDEDLFKRVYRNTFMCAKEKGQKALSLETAMVYWDLLFAPPGKVWQTGSTDWLKLWTDFLKQNWSKTVNRDMWNQTYVFHLKTMEDPSLGFWNEDGAWPSVVDEFVAWAKKNRGDGEGVDTMETD